MTKHIVLPRLEDEERSIISAGLHEPACWSQIADLLLPDHFYDTNHQRIIQAVNFLLSEGIDINLSTLASKVEELGGIENGAGPYTFLTRLEKHTASGNIPYQAGLIRKTATRRKVLKEIYGLLKAAQGNGPQADYEEKLLETHDLLKEVITETSVQKDGFRSIGFPPPRAEMAITDTELESASLSPPCLVRNYLYHDVGIFNAPGGTGKSTLILYELIHIVLGRPLYGLDVVNPGWCLFVTDEDSRETLIARLREIMRDMDLTPDERKKVIANILIWDVRGQSLKLVCEKNGSIVPTSLADNIVSIYKDDPPAKIVFDPLVSFGFSEGRVNDNENGLIAAGRRIVRGLDCCVRYVHHTGQVNARTKALDQYAGRGGTAAPDGSRMTAIMQSWRPGDDRRPPAGCTHRPESSIMILARPKLSYSPPHLPNIWIRRTGWTFEHYIEFVVSDEERQNALFDQIERFLASQVRQGIKHSKSSLETEIPGVGKSEARRAILQLIAQGRILEKRLPKDERQGSKTYYLVTPPERGGVRRSGEK